VVFRSDFPFFQKFTKIAEVLLELQVYFDLDSCCELTPYSCHDISVVPGRSSSLFRVARFWARVIETSFLFFPSLFF